MIGCWAWLLFRCWRGLILGVADYELIGAEGEP